MLDTLMPLAFAVLLQVLKDAGPDSKWRAGLLKVFRQIAIVFRDDAEFFAVAKANLRKS